MQCVPLNVLPLSVARCLEIFASFSSHAVSKLATFGMSPPLAFLSSFTRTCRLSNAASLFSVLDFKTFTCLLFTFSYLFELRCIIYYFVYIVNG